MHTQASLLLLRGKCGIRHDIPAGCLVVPSEGCSSAAQQKVRSNQHLQNGSWEQKAQHYGHRTEGQYWMDLHVLAALQNLSPSASPGYRTQTMQLLHMR